MSLAALLDEIAAEAARAEDRGAVAAYIPELARVDPRRFAIAVADAGGQVTAAGEADRRFSVQSVSKVLTLALALERTGEALWSRVGREPSGTPFNSIVQLERERGIPRNPFINAGALVVADALLDGRAPGDALEEVRAAAARLAGAPDIAVDAAVAASEARTGARNRSLANFLAAEGNLRAPVEDVLALYFGHCALAMSAAELARAGRFLAFGGVAEGGAVCSPATARSVLALMLTCGHYDGSGEFAWRVGLPGKSGVGGGILAIAPGRAAVAVWSPGLGPAGTSRLGAAALETLARRTGWSVFARP